MLAEIFGIDGVIILLVVVVVLFGSSQLPKLARSLGSAQSEFKKGIAEGHSEKAADTPAAPVPPSTNGTGTTTPNTATTPE